MFTPSLPEERASESMGTQEEGNGLSLEGLAHRLETLERENERMRSENAELRSEVAELKGTDPARAVEEPEPASSSEKRRVSRSWLLRNAGAAAVGTMAAGALLARDASVAKANHFAPGISVDFVVTHLETAGSTAVLGNAPNGEGVVGFGKTNGVRGEGQTGVFGKTSATGFSGVTGQNTGSGYGVVGDGTGIFFAGVLGRNSSITDGSGVRGEGVIGVEGRVTQNGGIGVSGSVPGSLRGTGIVGSGKGLNHTGVLGQNFSGTGVYGIGAAVGVHGQSNVGYAGTFDGGKAQLRIVPLSGTGRPTSGSFSKGDLYLDTNAALFVCVASGTPGTWRRFQTVAA